MLQTTGGKRGLTDKIRGPRRLDDRPRVAAKRMYTVQAVRCDALVRPEDDGVPEVESDVGRVHGAVLCCLGAPEGGMSGVRAEFAGRPISGGRGNRWSESAGTRDHQDTDGQTTATHRRLQAQMTQRHVSLLCFVIVGLKGGRAHPATPHSSHHLNGQSDRRMDTPTHQ